MVNIHSFCCNDNQVNCYVVYDSKGHTAVIDPGFCSEAEKRSFDSYISFLGLKLQMVLITHAHAAHVLGCSYVMNRYNVPLYLNKLELSNLEDTPERALSFGYDVDKVSSNYFFISSKSELCCGNILIDVMDTPGHSKGGISFLLKSEKCLFTGDTLCHNDIGKTDVVGAEQRVLANTVRKFMSMDPSITIFPGHGPETCLAYEKSNNRRLKSLVEAYV